MKYRVVGKRNTAAPDEEQNAFFEVDVYLDN
jgi:hypothetical protein